MTHMSQMGVIPGLLIILAGLLALHGEDRERARRRFFVFLVVVSFLIFLLLLVTSQIDPNQGDMTAFQLAGLLLPSVVGVLVLVVLNIRQLRGMSRGMQVVVVGMMLAQVGVVILLWGSRLSVEFFVIPGVVILVVGWNLGRRRPWLAVTLSVITLFGTFVMFQNVARTPGNGPPPVWLQILTLVSFAAPGWSIVLSAVLLTTLLKPAADSSSRLLRGVMIVLAVALPAYLAYIIFWGSLWDHTSDGLFGLAVTLPAGMVAIGAGMLMTVTLRGRARLAGLLFLIGMPLLIFQAFELGWQVSYHEITEGRAARIAQALDQFHAREGTYPPTLDALVPRDVLFIEPPVVLRGEDWCYQGENDSFRLGAFYREYFSSPVSLRVYQSIGETPAAPWPCEAREAEIYERYNAWMDNPQLRQPPQPTPLPPSDLDFPRTELRPLLDGIHAAPGSWSPDSAYYVFGAPSAGEAMTLYFLDAASGEVCAAPGEFEPVEILRQRLAWLPDGRLLVLDPGRDLVVLTPCAADSVSLADRLPESVTKIGAYAPETGLLLLESDDTYWILDGQSFDLLPVQGVAPSLYDLHWDNFSWLAGGEQLIISHLNGRDHTEGSTLYVISGRSGQVEGQIALAEASDQSAPWVEGLVGQQVLVQGIGVMRIVDFGTDPPTDIPVLADIFDLDVDAPNELASSGSLVEADGSYYLAARLNHPRNQALYIYHNTDGHIDRIDNDAPTLLLFPDHQLWEMSPLRSPPTYADTYDVIAVGADVQAPIHLVIPGHVPRDYPNLSFSYLAPGNQIAAASSQGISLQALASGELVAFWTLVGEGFAPHLAAAPDGSALVASRDYGGLYWLGPAQLAP